MPTTLDPEKQDGGVGRGKALESVTPGLRPLFSCDLGRSHNFPLSLHLLAVKRGSQ